MEHNIILYDRLTVVFGIAAVIFLIVTVIFYIVYGIKAIIRKRLGLTQKQELRRMQRQAEEAQEASHKKLHGQMFMSEEKPLTRSRHRETPYQREDEKPVRTESILETLEHEQEMVRKEKEERLAYAYDNETIILGDGGTTDVPEADTQTEMLGTDGATDVLGADAKTVMLGDDGATEMLQVDAQTEMLGDAASADSIYLEETAPTSVLDTSKGIHQPHEGLSDGEALPEQFTLFKHIMMIHTDELIA